MRQPELDAVLGAMLDTHPGISDLVFSVNRPLQVETFGELKEAVIAQPAIRRLTRYQTEQVALTILGNQRHLLQDLVKRGACDCSYALQDRARFRVNIFKQRRVRHHHAESADGNAVAHLPRADSPIFRDMAREKNGLILVTGAAGSGKTTTLSANLE